LAYTVMMLTIGGAIAVFAALVVLVSLVAVISPLLTAMGDPVIIGPFTVSTVPQSVLASVIGVAALTGLVVTSPAFSRAHALLVLQVLTRPEQRLQHDLTLTAQSRARLVRAFDIERRRIERDLHDGVQPQLLSVSMTLGLALAAMPDDAPGRSDVARAQDQAKQTLGALRSFVRNIHPQVLIDHGLGAAIRELADTLTLPIAVEDRLTGRLPTEIETNLYFCVAELLTNVVKHSNAGQAQVRLQRPAPGLVEVRVRDDGGGGAGTAHRDNGGLNGISDRIAALDGDLEIDSPLGGPTAITIAIPVPAVGKGPPDD
jgi:signal transduction histidine kinase